MANVYTTNPILIDTFSGDLDIGNLAFGLSATPFYIKKLVFSDPTAADIILLKDNRLAVVAEIQCTTTNLPIQQDFNAGYCSQGLKIVATDCTVTTGKLLIYV